MFLDESQQIVVSIYQMKLAGILTAVAYLGEGKGGHVPRAPLQGGAEIDLVYLKDCTNHLAQLGQREVKISVHVYRRKM